MAGKVKSVVVDPNSELARALDDADKVPVVLIRDGRRFRVEVDDPWASYDPSRLMEGIEKARGSITPEDADAWIANIYRWREEGSRHGPRE